MDQAGQVGESRLVLPRGPASVGVARKFVAKIADPDFEEVARLLVSELSSNAVVHGAGDFFEVRVRRFDRSVRVEVTDASRKLPIPLEADPERIGGRGLVLVDTLSSQWGVDLDPAGKTVWFELERRPAPGASGR